MTAATAALRRCDREACDRWLPADQLETVGRLSFCSGCARWEQQYRETEAAARRAVAVAALTPPPACQPCCVPCKHNLRADGLHEIDGTWFTHARPAAYYRWREAREAAGRAQ